MKKRGNNMNKKLISIVASMILLAVIFSGAGNENQSSNDATIDDMRDVDWWQTYRHDPAQTGFSLSSAPTSTFQYVVSVPGNPSSPVVVNNCIYVTSSNGNIYCLDVAYGQEIWSNTTGGIDYHSSPAVADGRVFVGSTDKNLYCFDALDGDLLWNKTTGDKIYSPPIYFGDRVVVYSKDNKLYCYNAINGDLHWSNVTTGSTTYYSSPAAADGKVYFFNYNGILSCFDIMDGQLIWSNTTTSAGLGASPAVVDGYVYIGTTPYLRCFDAENGEQEWQSSISGHVESCPAVAYGKVYIQTRRGIYCKYADNGTNIWSKTWSEHMNQFSSPAVAEGKVYIGDGIAKRLNCYDADNGTILWYKVFSTFIFTSPAIADSFLYVTTYSSTNNLYCYGGPNNPPVPPDQPSGPSEGTVGFEYTYTTVTSDPDSEQVQYGWDWNGNGVVDEWTDFYQSDVQIQTSHMWTETGSFDIKVKARDYSGNEGNWSPTFSVTMTNTAPDKPETPVGPTIGRPTEQYTYTFQATDPDGHRVRYYIDWGTSGGTTTAYQESGVPYNVSHIWYDAGVYEVRYYAEDEFGANSSWSDSLTVTIYNSPPETPNQPEGPTEGYVDETYTYSTDPVSDPDDDEVFYQFDWDAAGDHDYSDWLSTPEDSKEWSVAGDYEVKVRAKDNYESPSNWSESTLVSIKKTEIEIVEIKGGRGITATIKNIGKEQAENIEWSITIEGGLFFLTSRNESGVIDSLDPDESVEIPEVDPPMDVIGIGLGIFTPMPTIIVRASSVDTNSVELSAEARIIIKFVNIIKDDSSHLFSFFNKIKE